ncbi:MAG: hypothetical protein ACE5H3_01640 [Planctomycetota bacterium]
MTRRDQVRLAALGLTLVLVLIVFFSLSRTFRKETGEAGTQSGEETQSTLLLPPVDKAALAGVQDARTEDRFLLEPEAFRSLARSARTLLPAHLRRLHEPSLPFGALEEKAPALRGEPFRQRGELLDFQTLIRTVEGPRESWCWIRTDSGHDLFFVAQEEPKELFASQNYVVADGYFFKIYTRVLDGKRVTAPLLVGRELRPSFRPLPPANEVDMALLARVKDHSLGEKGPPDADGLWHLLNVARTLGQSKEELENRFRDALVLDADLFKDLAQEPSLYHGRPFVLECRVVESWYEAAGENPLREDFLTYGFAGNLNWPPNPIEVILPGKKTLPTRGDKNNARIFLGWFLQLEGYQAQDGMSALMPDFVVAGERPVPPREAPPWVHQLMVAFLVVAVALGIFLTWMIRRDRKAARALTARRRELAARRRPRNP